MEKFNYDEYVSNRNDILESFDKFCDDLEDRAISNFGKVDNERGIGGDFIKDLGTHRKSRGSGSTITESDVNVSSAIFDGLCEDI